MDYKEATDRVLERITTRDLASELGISQDAVARTRQDPATRGSRPPPDGWKAAVARLAGERASRLLRLKTELIGPPRAASGTAHGVAVMRAAHLIMDGEPPVLNDTVAARLLGSDMEAQIRARADELRTPAALGLRSHVVLRSRFAEDTLMAAVANGVEQYVLLGAGLDTFAYRQPEWAQGLTVIEVDHPGTQAAKRGALAAAGVEIPPNVRFADIDFERETLSQGLARCRVHTGKPTFFSWLGVTMYLTRDAIEATLRTVLSFPKGSGIVLTYAHTDSANSRMATGSASAGEPWVSYFTPDEVEAMLRSLGFSDVGSLTREEAERRYYANRTDGFEAPPRVSIVAASVGHGQQGSLPADAGSRNGGAVLPTPRQREPLHHPTPGPSPVIAPAPEIPPDTRDAHRRLSPAAERFLQHLVDHPDQAAQLAGIEKGLPDWAIPLDITWPTLVDARRVAEMERATVGMCKLIKAIPAVVFGGNLGAIAAFYAYDPILLAGLFSVRDYMNSTVARCDFIDTPGGLMCCEVNLAANVGGWHQGFWHERYLRHPVIMDFCAREGISPGGRDVLSTFCEHVIDDALATGVIEAGGELNVVIDVGFPPSEGARHDAANVFAELLRRAGRGVTGQLWLSGAPAEELTFRGADVYMGERRVHVFYTSGPKPTPMQVLRAQVAGGIRVYNGGLTRMWVDKRNLALLSENEGLEAWTEEQRELIRDHIPWTRLVSPRTTTWRGAEVHFPGFLLDHRDDLVLKRGQGAGGTAVHVGRYLAPDAWEARVREALEEGEWIVQERVESRPYFYPPHPGAAPVPHSVIWGLFCTGSRYGGGGLRMLPQGAGKGIVSGGRGAYEGAILEI